jgi:hypothetical protein
MPGAPRAAILILAALLAAQGRDGFVGSFADPAIDYERAPLADSVTRLAQSVGDGSRALAYDAERGYLPAVLAALEIPVESQVAVFSKTSLQAPLISARNPRALYFNDHAAVGWVRGSDVLELTAQDPRQGMVFYRLTRDGSGAPRFERSRECLRCHVAWETLAVPGALVLSTGPEDAAGYATGGAVDDRDPIEARWGSWYVTGRSVPRRSLGTPITAPPWLAERADIRGFLSPHSDVVALMVLEHQARAMNLITYLGWETRVGASDGRLASIARDLVDYFLFVDEAPLPGAIEGSSRFAAVFAAGGRRDRQGRSLREFDLHGRLMRYPCSYMIESAAFDALPDRARRLVAARVLTVLSGGDADPKYGRLSAADRRAVLDILRDTKPDLFP